MKRYARDKTPYIKPVERIELSEKNIKLRVILMIVFLLLGAGAIAFGVRSCIAAEKGWQKIEVTSNAYSLSYDFILFYNIGETDKNASSEKKSVAATYTKAAQEAYRLYDEYAPEGWLLKINSEPGKAVEVDPELYSALQKITENDSRLLYRAPYYEYYELVFSAESDFEAEMYDPNKNEKTRELFLRISEFVNDKNAVNLEFNGNNTVTLHVSDMYSAFAKENEIANFISFSPLRNAFAAEHIAGRMREGGYTNGYLSSADGFTVYLNGKGYDYNVNLYDYDKSLACVCTVGIDQAKSSVYYKNYMLGPEDHGYTYKNGDTSTPYVNGDGLQANACEMLYVYSESLDCVDLALKTISVYTADETDEEKLREYRKDGLYAVYIKDKSIRYTEETLDLSETVNGYTKAYIK